MPVTTSDAAVYKMDAMTRVEMTPNGMSFCGLGSSSARVVTLSKPMKEKKTCGRRAQEAHETPRKDRERDENSARLKRAS
jgi:hypothetical protein